MNVLGIDIGGSALKGAVVDVSEGKFITEKRKYPTPSPSTPEAMMKIIFRIMDDFNWSNEKIGFGFPSIIKNDTIFSAANIDKSWLFADLDNLFRKRHSLNCKFINDADAAGLAEVKFGAGKKMENGTILMLTLGTGIGSGLFIDQKLVPNTEFGHLKHKKSIWEHYAGNKARVQKELSWEQWGKKLNEYLNHVEFIINPDLIILGGGVSKSFNQFQKFINLSTEVCAATLFNNAGIIGAAYHASVQ